MNSNEIINPEDYWSKDFLNNRYKPDEYADGFCAFAEHRFLSFFILLSKIFTNKINKKIKKVIIHSSDNYEIEALHAIGIQKQTVKVIKGIFKRNFYIFHEPTFLIMTGPLAGTIANESFQTLPLNNQCYGKNLTHVSAHRPLVAHQSIQSRIDIDIQFMAEASRVTQIPLNVHMLKLLEETKNQVNNFGYIGALIHILEKINIPHDQDIIRYNSKY